RGPRRSPWSRNRLARGRVPPPTPSTAWSGVSALTGVFAVGERGPRALGPPSPIADESRLTREPISEVVVDPSSIYVTLELRVASRETLEVTTTQNRLTVHALDRKSVV